MKKIEIVIPQQLEKIRFLSSFFFYLDSWNNDLLIIPSIIPRSKTSFSPAKWEYILLFRSLQSKETRKQKKRKKNPAKNNTYL